MGVKSPINVNGRLICDGKPTKNVHITDDLLTSS